MNFDVLRYLSTSCYVIIINEVNAPTSQAKFEPSPKNFTVFFKAPKILRSLNQTRKRDKIGIWFPRLLGSNALCLPCHPDRLWACRPPGGGGPRAGAPCLIGDGPLRHFGRPTCLLGFSKKVLQTSFNYCCSLISLLQLENRMFVLLELLKPTNLSPWVGFKAVLADVAPCQLSYVAPRQP